VTIGLDYTFLIQIINFLALIFILNLILYKPILAIIGRRKTQLDESESEISRLNETVEQKMAAYEEKLRQAKAGALEKKQEITQEGATTAKGIIDAVRGEIPGLVETFQARMNQEVSQARQILHDQSRRISVEIAEKVLGRSVQ
jgi:F-type H+-transporting ATPase subunit b